MNREKKYYFAANDYLASINDNSRVCCDFFATKKRSEINYKQTLLNMKKQDCIWLCQFKLNFDFY